MSTARIAALPDRGVVSVAGADAAKLLQGLITNDMDLVRAGGAIHAGLLSPQGKILFDFFVVEGDSGYLLETARDKSTDLVKRLTMYRLRANAAIADVTDQYRVFASWGGENSPAEASGSIVASFADPRDARLGRRFLADATRDNPFEGASVPLVGPEAYHAQRIAIGAPKGGTDYDYGDAFPHEANFDLFNGVSFTKGCFVGQEVVARMQNKAVVRKRIVRVAGTQRLVSGADILIERAPIGRVGSTDGASALAMLRLDRAIEAQEKGIELTSDGARVTADPTALKNYLAAAARASAGGPRP